MYVLSLTRTGSLFLLPNYLLKEVKKVKAPNELSVRL